MNELVEQYARGASLAAPIARVIEDRLIASPAMRDEVNTAVARIHADRLSAVFDAIIGDVVAPPRSRLERLLLAARCPEPTARLLAATPVLRWAWAIAVFVVLLFAAGAAGNDWRDADRLAVLLALAPIVPVLGVAAAYGPSADRAHEVALAAPLSGLRLLLVRTLAVLGGSIAITLVASAIAPGGGWLRLAWIVPSLATTACALALSTRLDVRRAATIVAVGWLMVVIVVAQLADDAVAPFRLPAQAVLASIAIAAVIVVVAGRRHLELIRR